MHSRGPSYCVRINYKREADDSSRPSWGTPSLRRKTYVEVATVCLYDTVHGLHVFSLEPPSSSAWIRCIIMPDGRDHGRG